MRSIVILCDDWENSTRNKKTSKMGKFVLWRFLIGYRADRKSISPYVLEIIADLYAQLLAIEKKEGIEASEKYLIEFLKERGDDIEFFSLLSLLRGSVYKSFLGILQTWIKLQE